MNSNLILILLFILIIIILCYNEYKHQVQITKFPFKVYDFSSLTKNKFDTITSINEPALFTNALKYNINFHDFCDTLANKPLKTRYGDYGDLNGHLTRKFKTIPLRDICNDINKSNQYGGNNTITLNEQIDANIKLNNKDLNISRNGQLWIGPNQSSTPLHKDKPKNLALQIYGEKKWSFFSNNDNKYLCFKDNNKKLEWSGYSINNYHTCSSAINAKKYEIIMKPGYMLYLPRQWAHQVTNESNSIMVNYWY